MDSQDNGADKSGEGRWSLAGPRRWAHGAAALALVVATWTTGSPASPPEATAAPKLAPPSQPAPPNQTVTPVNAPDLAIAVESLPRLAALKLVLKVTNLSRNTVATETGAQVVFQGGSPLTLGIPLYLTQVGGGGARIGTLNPGQSTTFSVETPVFYCIEYAQRAHSMGLAPPPFYAIATVTPAKSPTGVAEPNGSNNGVQITNLCQQYNTDVSNFRPEGVFPQVVIERRPDDAHPRELVLRVRNRGTEQVPPLSLRVGLGIGFYEDQPKSSLKNLREFSIPALAPDASVTVSYDLRLPCYYDLYVTAILWNIQKNQKYEDDLEDIFICDNVKSVDAKKDFDRTLGFKLQAVIVRRPDTAHPRGLLLAVRNIGTEFSPPGNFGVGTRKDNGADGFYRIPVLDPGESMSINHEINRPCPQHGGDPGDVVYLDGYISAYDDSIDDPVQFDHVNICD